MTESVKKSLIEISRLQLGFSESFDNKPAVKGASVIDEFLLNANYLFLCVYAENTDVLVFAKDLPVDKCEKVILFSKRHSVTANDREFWTNLQVNTISGTPTLDLYEFLNKVTLASNADKQFDKNVKSKISTLQSNLKNIILTQNIDYPFNERGDYFLQKFVDSVEDEVKYWTYAYKSKADKSANTFLNILNQIASDLSVVESLSLVEVEDLLEKCHNCLDDLWRCETPYPKERMKNLMDVIGRDTWKHVTQQLSTCTIWEDDYNKVSEKCLLNLNLCEKWLGTCQQLTELFWPNYSTNMWSEEPYQPDGLVRCAAILKEVMHVRTVHKQLFRLSTPEEQIELDPKNIFQPFKDIPLFNLDETDSKRLLKAKKDFELLLQPSEEKVALKLKKHLMTVNANSRQLIYEFTRYSELIGRPVLKKALQAERQYLLNSLKDYITQLQNQTNLDTNKIRTRQETSDAIKEIIFARQLQAKAQEVSFVTEKLLDDLDDYNNITSLIVGVEKGLKTQLGELFDAWCAEVTAEINSNKLSLKETDPVVQFSKDKLMIVNYPAKLAVLISEVRQLRAMNYKIPDLIAGTCEHAKTFMKYARILEQIANFHNTIGDRMVPSQKPMMLSSALELSKLVQQEEVVAWGDQKHVEKYVNSLKRAVEKLGQSNSFLSGHHIDIVDKIRDLENVSLLKEVPRWIDTIKSIQYIVNIVESKGYKNLQLWKKDIDGKICNILEAEYVKSLFSIHQGLNEIRVDLVYRNSTLYFSPDRQQLEQNYDQQLKRYIDIPKTFRGISDAADDIYPKIIDRNQEALQNTSKKKLELFDQLDAVKKHWQSWLQLEPIDPNKLNTWDHWDLHFRASKTFGQEIAKLPSAEERVGCFLVGLSRLRSDLESHNRSYWDQLVNSLKDSIAEDVVKLQNYIDPATASLTKQPVTLEEIGESGLNYSNIMTAYSEMETTYQHMLDKSKTLASWSREQVDSVKRLKGAWERLGGLISNHQHIMAKQMETIRTSLNIEQENLLKEIERFEAKWRQIESVHNSFDSNESSIDGIKKLFEEARSKRNEWNGVLAKREVLFSNYTKFNMEKPDIVIMNEVEAALEKEECAWKLFEEFNADFENFSSQYWIVFRKKYFDLENFIESWQTKLANEIDKIKYIPVIKKELEQYKHLVPVLKYIKGEDFSDKHWHSVFVLLKIPPKPIDQLLLKDLLEVQENIITHTKELQDLCKQAAGEIVIRQALKDIDQWEAQTHFLLTAHVDSSGKQIMLIEDFKDILNSIGDHKILLQSLKHSTSNFTSFLEHANHWESKLDSLDGYLSSLAQIQKRWLYLEPIFGGGTLAQEKVRFDRLDRDFRKIMAFVQRDPKVTELCRYPHLTSVLQSILDQLGRCQDGLDNFLKEKRNIFPRFLFLSDDDLLEIVGQSSREQIIQSHLKKIFAGIHSVCLDNSGERIESIASLQGEIVKLSHPIEIKCPVEVWLGQLVKEMQSTLKGLLVDCQKENQADPLKYPSQILCLSDNIAFTQKCEQAISGMGLPNLLVKYKAQLTELNSLELNKENTPNSTDSTILELKLKALLLDTIHHVKLLEELINNNVTKVSEWAWQKQLRYYTNSLGDVTIKMAQARMDYSYEYLGNEQKLVRTPLTERCFLTLTQAMQLGLGGNPYGPAGTGKTESVKALGSILGRQVLVFNCDEGIDATSMERILIGLVKTGAWGCFDEFNRLDETTLSAISMQIHAIQEALRNNAQVLKLTDQEVSIDKHCGIFVTLNPAGAGYGGRKKLPDNLKQLFRPVIMTHPDHEEIAKTSLYCDGFRYGDILAKKLNEVFVMSDKLMSRQQHYDWGLRSIKTVLSGCQATLRQLRADGKILTKTQEFGVVVSMLKMDVISKLTYSDTMKFQQLVANVFKDVPAESVDNTALREAVVEAYRELNLIVNERQVNKCLEFYKQLKQRMGVTIIGPPGSGKSTIIKVVAQAIAKIYKKIKMYPVNPKSVSRQLLLGYIDQLNQWNNGILTSYSLQACATGSDGTTWSWIVCDGDIDPEWIESLNSVLDDNRLMTLPSGWRIHFGPDVNFVFETHDLQNASPATISRMGIVYLSSEDMDLNGFLRAFLINEVPEEQREELEFWMEKIFVKSLDWAWKEAELSLSRSLISVAKTGFCQLQNVKSKAGFAVGIINGIGQQLKTEFRPTFIENVFEWADEPLPGSLSDLYYDPERDLVDNYCTDTNAALRNIEGEFTLIKTGAMQKTLDILGSFVLENKELNFMLVGQHGCGKRLIIRHLFLDRSDVDVAEVNCCADLSTNYIISKIEQLCISVNTSKGNVLKPKKGKLVVYCRNLHLLTADTWGSNTIIQFLTQFIEYKGYFNKKTEFVQVENVTIVVSLLPCQHISERFLSKLHLVNVDLPEKEDLSVLLIACLSAVIKTYFPAINYPKTKITKLVMTMLTIYEEVKSYTTSQIHSICAANPHDLVRWCLNFKYYSKPDIAEFDVYILEILIYEALQIFEENFTRFNERATFIASLKDIFRRLWDMEEAIDRLAMTYFVPKFEALNKSFVFENCLKDSWQYKVERGVTQFGKECQELDIIVNDEILKLTAAVLRCLVIPEYHLLLIGKAGIGRKTSIKIASVLLSKRIIQPASERFPWFQNDLKLAVQYAGIECEDVILILEDHIFVEKSNLNLINLLISSGEVHNLYSDIEAESLVKSLKDRMESENFEGELSQFFATNIRKHLHVFICLDRDNAGFFDILKRCPAFSQKSGRIWLDKWSENTIKLFPNKLINRLRGTESKESCETFLSFFKLLSNTTSFRYISMIKLYANIYKEKQLSINSNITKLESGVFKLTEAKSLVEQLKQKAAEEQEKLAEKQAKANAALDMISNTIKGANVQKEEMEVLKKKTEGENLQLNKRKNEIEEELAEVEPLIREARAAVGNIKTESISEIRSLRAPPEIIRDILEGVLKLMGTQDTSWNSMKTFLAKRGVKEEIRSFDAHRIQTENRQAVERLMTMKRDSFDPKSAKRASVAAAPLAAWVEANVKYSKVLDKIRPLEREQYKLKENLDSAENQLVELNANLTDVDTTVAKLKQQLAQYTKEAAEVEIGLNEVNETLKTSENLVNKLADEYERWQSQLQDFTKQLQDLSTNSLLAAAFITYLSEKEDDNRRELLRICSVQLGNTNFDLLSFFSTEREQFCWQSEGLPNDKVSLENAVVIQRGQLPPLLIDPNSTALQWLKAHFKRNAQDFEHIAFNSPKLNTVLEASVRFGRILLIEELEEVPCALFPILRGDFTLRGERRLVQLLGKQVDYHSNFKLIMCSRNESVQISAEIAPFLCVLNFNVTYSGFTEQLLAAAVTQEKPELESRREQLLRENEGLQVKLTSLQDQLLDCLANSDGNILNNKNLLATLNEIKTGSMAVVDALLESNRIRNALRKEYEEFLDISSFASGLYFACKQFATFNVLYSFSTGTFIKLFLQCLQAIQEKSNVQKRHIHQTIYRYLCRGMFKNDRLSFLLHLTYRMFPEKMPETEMGVFLNNANYSQSVLTSDYDLPSWVPATSMNTLSNIKRQLPDLYQKCQLNERNLWSEFMESSQCEKYFPKHCCDLADFEKLIIIQSLRPDNLLTSIESCCSHISGLKAALVPVLSLQSVCNESNSNEPILLVTSPGMDPSTEIRDLAKNLDQNCVEISMGEGRESDALTRLHECRKNGKWLILKNLQLVTCWLPTLAQAINYSPDSSNFRLWLITESTEKFNVVLAQHCIKIAYEEPEGVANNLQRIYSSLGEKYNNKLNRISARLFFAFSCLHALLQERRKYIPQGWSKYYEFNHTDMQVGLNLTEDFWNTESNRVQWQFINGLLNEAVYGGRIENMDDVSILETYVKNCFNDEVLSHKWRPFGLDVNLPNTGQNKDYLQAVKQFPNKDHPSIFGLPGNIDKTREKQTSSKIISKLKEFYQFQNKATADKSVNFKELHSYFALWKKLNQRHDFIKSASSDVSYKGNSAIEALILEEYGKGVSLLQFIHKILSTLNKVSKGNLEPTDEDVLVAKQLIQSQTPELFINIWDGPKNCKQYLEEVVQRTIYLANCKNEVSSLLKQPVKLWMFFNSEAFLASSKQEFAKTSNSSLEDFVLQATWQNSQSCNIILSDLLIEGGLIENGQLKQSNETLDCITSIASCYLQWTEQEKLDVENFTQIPLYASSSREKKIATFFVKCDPILKGHFILSSLALYLTY